MLKQKSKKIEELKKSESEVMTKISEIACNFMSSRNSISDTIIYIKENKNDEIYNLIFSDINNLHNGILKLIDNLTKVKLNLIYLINFYTNENINTSTTLNDYIKQQYDKLELKVKGTRMKKAFISVPMKNKHKKEIENDINVMKAKVEEMYDNVHFVNTIVEDKPPYETNNEAIWYLSKSIELLSYCDILVCKKNVDKYNGCFIEKEIAKRYGLEIIEVEQYGQIY